MCNLSLTFNYYFCNVLNDFIFPWQMNKLKQKLKTNYENVCY